MTAHMHAVILNYNSHAATLRALRELGAAEGVRVDVLVVDCASEAGDRAPLLQNIPADRLLLLKQNRGYAGGMNAGLQFWLERSSEIPILLVTPDAHVTGNVVQQLLRVLENDAQVGVVGPVIVYQDSPPRRIAAGGSLDKRGRVAPITEVRAEEPYDADWLDGCCLLLRPEAARAVHGFDEEYFLYYEETDLCRRLRSAGWKVMVVPSATVLHPKSRSSAPPHYYYYMARNGYRFRARHFGVSTGAHAFDLLRTTAHITSIALAATFMPWHWHQARDRWRNCLLLWRGVLAGTRDHIRGRYGPQRAPTPAPE